MGSLPERWREWEALPYPTDEVPLGSEAAWPVGVDLALLDGDVDAVLYHFCEHGELDAEQRTLLESSIAELERVVPELRGYSRNYFATALELLTGVRARVPSSPKRTNPNLSR